MSKLAWIVVAVFCVVVASVSVNWFGRLGIVNSSANKTSQTLSASFVSDRRCADCHGDEAALHAKSGHAHTYRPGDDAEIVAALDGTEFTDPYRGTIFKYEHRPGKGMFVSLDDNPDAEFRLQYALGSGQNAITFMTLVADDYGDSLGLEHRVSLYRTLDDGFELGLTPGQSSLQVRTAIDRFGRSMRGDALDECIGCHTVDFDFAGDALRGLQPHVGCQSCHGPGAAHIASCEGTLTDDEFSYATPAHGKMELDMCGKCHRLPLSSGPVPQEQSVQNVRFQPGSLMMSECCKQSESLSCSTCHDPHGPVSRETQHYEDRCLSCHGGASQTPCPVSPRENCVGCHMPATTVHRRISFHDHWIRIPSDSSQSRTGDSE